jgi:hypothetical protein
LYLKNLWIDTDSIYISLFYSNSLSTLGFKGSFS